MNLAPPQCSWAEKLAYLTYRLRPLADAPPEESCPVEHIFEPGVYIREMRIPAGMLFIGRPHRHGHRCALLEGSVIHITEANAPHGVQRDAPFEVMTAPGTQMVLKTLTDVVGRTYHPNPTESRDVAALEADAFHPLEDMLKLGKTVEMREAELLV